jgi:hypothetical protein
MQVSASKAIYVACLALVDQVDNQLPHAQRGSGIEHHLLEIRERVQHTRDFLAPEPEAL